MEKFFYWYSQTIQVSLSQGRELKFQGDKVVSGTRLLTLRLLAMTGLFLVLVSLVRGTKSSALGNKEISPAGPSAFPRSLLLVLPTHLSLWSSKGGEYFLYFWQGSWLVSLALVFRGTPTRSRGKNELLGYLLLLGGKLENARSSWSPSVD